MTDVTPTDRPKSVHNRCVIEVFGGVFCVVTLLFGVFCGCKGFCHRTESDIFFFLLVSVADRANGLTRWISILTGQRLGLFESGRRHIF